MIKYYCNKCNKPIFEEINQRIKESTTIAEIETRCVCSDCIFEELRKDQEEIKAALHK